MPDEDVRVAEAIRTTTAELEQARVVVRDLANELGDVIEVIEPALAEHIARLRQARMSSLDEIRQITNAIKSMKDVLLSPQTDQMLTRAERFLRVCRDLEEFRGVGFLDAFVELFVKHGVSS